MHVVKSMLHDVEKQGCKGTVTLGKIDAHKLGDLFTKLDQLNHKYRNMKSNNYR